MIDRVFFDKALAHDAAKAGAEIMLKTSAVSLIKEGGTIKELSWSPTAKISRSMLVPWLAPMGTSPRSEDGPG